MQSQPTQQISVPPQRSRPIPQPLPAPRTAPKRGNKTLLILGMLAAGAAFILIMMLGLLGLIILASNSKVADGVTVANVNLGGLKASEAEALLTQELRDRPLTLADGDRQWQTSYQAMGLTLDVETTMQAIEAAESGQQVMPRYTLDLSQAQRGLVALSDQINIDAVPGRDARNGRVMEIPVMLDRLRVDAVTEFSDGVFDLTMMDVEPPPVEALASYTGERTTHVVEAGQELGLIAKEYGVDMADIIALNDITDANFIYPGQELIIPAGGAYMPDSADAPPAPLQQGKSIVVDTNRQRIFAYENGSLIRSHLTSTGRQETPTVLGDYKIYVKYVKDDMRGPDYFLPEVPYTMYFYQGYGIHGTYWHNSFGRQMSHGCVNLPVDEAEWFFNWAEVGTTVRVI